MGFVTPNLVLGGAERWILNMLRYLDGDRIALSGVCLLNAAPADLEMCIDASQFAPVVGGPIFAAPGSEQRLEQSPDSPPVIRLDSAFGALAVLCRRSDVIVAWGSQHFARLMAAQHFAGQVVVVAHGSAVSTVQMLRTSREAAHHLVGVSRAAAAAFQDPRARVIHNGADSARCAATMPREETRRRWGVSVGETLIGYVGRLSWEKNPLAAAQAVCELGPGHRAVYVGSGVHEEEVKARVRQIAPNSIFVPPIEQIGDALAALDVFLLASPSEGFSLALTEAWLCGVPAAATRVGAVPELEELHGQMVVPVSVGASPAELAAAVRRAVAAEGQAVARRAQAIAERHYTARAMADRWSEFLTSIVSMHQAEMSLAKT